MKITTQVAGWVRSFGVGRPMSVRPRQRASRNRRRTAAVAIAAGMVAVIVLQFGFGLVAECVFWLKDPGYADKELKLARQEAANPAAPSVVMLGTSRTGAGFQAGRVRDQLATAINGRAIVFNFGIPASGPVTHLVYLRRLLADGHKPDLLLVEVLPPTLSDQPAGPQTPAGPLEDRFLFGDRLRHTETEVVIEYGFPADAIRKKWRESVLLPWSALRFPLMGRVFPSAIPWHLRFDWSRSSDEFGWGAPISPTVTPKEYAAGLSRASGEYRDILWDLHPDGGGARALADLLALCREHRIPVRLILMPEAVGFRAMYSPVVLERLHRFLDRLCTEYQCDLINAREWLPDSAFTDGHHLLKSGSEALSDRLLHETILPFFRAPGERLR